MKIPAKTSIFCRLNYSLTDMNKGGNIRVYEQWPAFMSVINGAQFFILSYHNFDKDEGGYFFKLSDAKERS